MDALATGNGIMPLTICNHTKSPVQIHSSNFATDHRRYITAVT